MLVANLIFALSCINAAEKLHLNLLVAALRWTMFYYDTSPVGRILNRFSADVQAVDNTLPAILQSGMTLFFRVTIRFLKKSLLENLSVI